ncbi:hypothetical protein N7462_002775 [Penicillium macrosclerotiorum]|uniref:uncharacterized protein n=1 Tax=Penicillium macrosclerotiorum TaxID=303699 RepID=UPI002546626B|nr:uncharacterized protein N7462_002775 [Penicillium macrosclerotiorum]KAJ5693352.1 hypothetical protein N7462_002775 [Penicillium macrosclerotiorum]
MRQWQDPPCTRYMQVAGQPATTSPTCSLALNGRQCPQAQLGRSARESRWHPIKVSSTSARHWPAAYSRGTEYKQGPDALAYLIPPPTEPLDPTVPEEICSLYVKPAKVCPPSLIFLGCHF